MLSGPLQDLRKKLALEILQLHKRAHAGHIGSSLSCLEILIYLYHEMVRPQDQVILSKGHAATALYVVLNHFGKLTVPLSEYYKEAGQLPAHPPTHLRTSALPFGTGSLGHGLSLACGLALSAKLKSEDRKIFAVLSDGDCNSGSTWEALHFAVQQKLNNLFVIFDLNGLQGLGSASETLDFEPIGKKLSLMGFDVEEVSKGNSFQDLAQGAEKLKNSKNPSVVIARTMKGHGLSFMEGRLESHYLPLTEEQYEQAVREVQGLS